MARFYSELAICQRACWRRIARSIRPWRRRRRRWPRILEWHWDPDPADTTYIVDYAFLLREKGGDARVVHDRHIEGLFPRQVWLDAFHAAGFPASRSLDQFGRDVFIAHPV